MHLNFITAKYIFKYILTYGVWVGKMYYVSTYIKLT